MPEENVDITDQSQSDITGDVTDREPDLSDEFAAMKDMLDGNTSGGGESASNTVASKQVKSILSMRVPLIVKVAQKKMTMENVLKLSLGSIIQFDKDVYENIELMVNNQTIGLGQPVKIGENFGLRLLQVGDIEHTIKSLGGK